MKKIFLIALVCLLFSTFAFNVVDAATRVKGHYRKNGTYVQPYYRSDADGSPYNNYSFPGNTNPFTGKTATGSVDSYLKNYNLPSATYTVPTYKIPSSTLPPLSSLLLPSTPTYSTCTSSISYPGYYFNGFNWYYDSNCTMQYNPYEVKSICPVNSTLNSDGKCYCNIGYKITDNQCKLSFDLSFIFTTPNTSSTSTIPTSNSTPQQWCNTNNPNLHAEAFVYPNGNFSCTCYNSRDISSRLITNCQKQGI